MFVNITLTVLTLKQVTHQPTMPLIDVNLYGKASLLLLHFFAALLQEFEELRSVLLICAAIDLPQR